MKDDLGRLLANSLNGLVEGAADDLVACGEAIAADLLRAARRTGASRDELLGELQAQGKLLLEVHRLRLVKRADHVLGRILEVAFGALRSALGGVA